MQDSLKVKSHSVFDNGAMGGSMGGSMGGGNGGGMGGGGN
jgi:hypothetical protein